MALDLAAFRQTVFDWASGESGLTTIFERPNQPRPSTPYVSLNIVGGPVKQGGQQEVRFDDPTFSVNALLALTVSVKAYGNQTNDPISILTNLQLSLGKLEVLESLRSGGIAVWNEGPISDISEVLETGFEERANMDVLFAASHSTVTDGGLIEKVDLSGEVEADTGNTIDVPEETIE